MLDCGPSHEKFYEQPITGTFANWLQETSDINFLAIELITSTVAADCCADALVKFGATIYDHLMHLGVYGKNWLSCFICKITTN